jgi:hypothetical protein
VIGGVGDVAVVVVLKRRLVFGVAVEVDELGHLGGSLRLSESSQTFEGGPRERTL